MNNLAEAIFELPRSPVSQLFLKLRLYLSRFKQQAVLILPSILSWYFWHFCLELHSSISLMCHYLSFDLEEASRLDKIVDQSFTRQINFLRLPFTSVSKNFRLKFEIILVFISKLFIKWDHLSKARRQYYLSLICTQLAPAWNQV